MSTDKGLTIQMEVKQAWLNNQTLYFPATVADFFPADCFGARGDPDRVELPPRGVPVTLVYAGVAITTDIAKEVSSGRLRPRDRGSLRQFYKVTGAEAGDFVVVTRVKPRVFEIALVKSNGAAV